MDYTITHCCSTSVQDELSCSPSRLGPLARKTYFGYSFAPMFPSLMKQFWSIMHTAGQFKSSSVPANAILVIFYHFTLSFALSHRSRIFLNLIIYSIKKNF